MNVKAYDLWERIKQNLTERISPNGFSEWITPCVPLRVEDNTLWIQVPTPSAKIWIEQQFLEEFHEALSKLELPNLQIVFQVSGSLPPLAPVVSKPMDPTDTVVATLPMLFSRYTLDRFVVGPNSQLAFSAAHAVVENFGKGGVLNMNPLFIYGASGLGKTHLMVGVGQAIRAKNPALRVGYVKVDVFFHEVTAAIVKRNTEPLRKKYQENDVLLLDDVQTLGKMERSQEEIFYVLEYLLQHGKQIVITSDKPPQQLEGLHERLKTRFKWGLTADIQPPDLETRVAILKKKLEDLDYGSTFLVSDEILSLVAQKGKGSVRDLEGLLNRVMFQAGVRGSAPSIEGVLEAFRGQSGDEASNTVSMERIFRAVAESFSIPYGDLKRKKSRESSVLIPRQVAMYLARDLAGASLVDIAKEFDMHHSTVMNAIESVKQRMSKDGDFHKLVHALLNTVY